MNSKNEIEQTPMSAKKLNRKSPAVFLSGLLLCLSACGVKGPPQPPDELPRIGNGRTKYSKLKPKKIESSIDWEAQDSIDTKSEDLDDFED